MRPGATLDLPEKVFLAYRKDFENGTITLGNVCNARCFFCSQRMSPPGVLQDYPRLLTFEQITSLSRYLDPRRPISIGSARHLSSGEFFLHPRASDVLRLLPATTPINAFTNGLSVSERDLAALKRRRVQLSFSINDVSLENRLELMGGSPDDHRRALALPGALERFGIDYSLWILPTRKRLANGDLEYCFKQLAGLRRRFCLHTPGYTRYAPESAVRELAIPTEELVELCVTVHGRYGVEVGLENMPPLQRAGDHAAHVAGELLRGLAALRTSGRVGDGAGCLFLCSSAVRGLFGATLGAAGLGRARWRSVGSAVFGGNVSCAGLLLVDDYLGAIEEDVADGHERPRKIVLPRISFDVNCEDLAMRPASDLEQAVRCPVVLA
jgi:hypothetical protein